MGLIWLLAVGHGLTALGGDVKVQFSPFEDLDVIPRVDLSQPRSQVIEAVRKAANVGGPGFFYLMNHGIPESVFDNAIREAHRFFSQPHHKKMNISAVGYGGGSKPTKGYVPPAAEGRYEKDASDVRPDTHIATGLPNSRESLTYRFPEMDAVHQEAYMTNYDEFLHELNAIEKVEKNFLASEQRGSAAKNARLYPSHPSNRVAETAEIAQAARRFFSENQWPAEIELPSFKDAVNKYFNEMRQLASTMFEVFLAAIAPGLTLPRDKGMMTFNLAHYAAGGEGASLNESYGIVDHTDWEMFTLLYPKYLQTKHVDACGDLHSDSPRAEECLALAHSDESIGQNVSDTGLEVWYQGEWLQVPHLRGAILVNQGEMLSRLSQGLFKAPVHRVRNTAFERYSLVSFWGPNYEVMIPDPNAPCGKVLAGEHYLKRNAFV